MATLKQMWYDFREYERHEMPWPIMVLLAFIIVALIAGGLNGK